MRQGDDLSSVIYLSPVLMLLFLLFVLYSAYSRSTAMVRKMKSPHMKYRITDKWFYVESELSSGKNSWSVFKGLQKNARLWLIVIHSGAAFVIPAEFLDEKLKTFLSSKLPTKPVNYLTKTFKIVALWLLAVIVVLYWIRRG